MHEACSSSEVLQEAGPVSVDAPLEVPQKPVNVFFSEF